MARIFSWLPRGRALPPEVWAFRHRGLLLILAAHLFFLPAFAATQGWSLGAAWAFDIAPALFGAIACLPQLSRAARSSACAIALLCCSAVLVVAWHGTIEAHFHYFVMVGALALYEEWWAYLLAIGFVVLQHGLMGGMLSHAVFNHANHSWRWAGIHGIFVVGLVIAELVSWRASERSRAKTASSEERFRRAFDDAPVAIALVSPRGRILQGNRELRERTGHDSPEGMWFWDFVPVEDRYDLYSAWPPRDDTPETERRYVREDGTIGWILWRHSLIRDDDGRPDHYISQGVDITARKRDAERLDFQAHHDPLTNLPNRTLFDRVLAEAIERKPELGGEVAVVFADIDNFKVINDSLGHRTGDELLVAVAERFSHELRPDDVIARFGGDEFVILLERVEDLEDVRGVADRLADAIRAPFELDGQHRFVSASFGVALAEGAAVCADDLIRDADAAMYQAKEQGKARLEFFDESLRTRAIERLELEAGLRDALACGQLELHYQPEIRLADGHMFGTEALLRWVHPHARDDLAGPVHPDRRAERADRADRRVGAHHRLPPGRRVDRRRPRGLRDVGEPLSAPALFAEPRFGRRARPGRERDSGVSAVPGDHRERDHGGPGGRARDPPGPEGARRAARDRRLRRRLLLALAPQVPAAGRRHQDRQVLRRRAARFRRQPRDHHRDHPALARARRAGRRRGRRARRAG